MWLENYVDKLNWLNNSKYNTYVFCIKSVIGLCALEASKIAHPHGVELIHSSFAIALFDMLSF